MEQGYSVEDAHRAAQTTVNSIFGTTEPSVSGATGSSDPAPGAVGPKLPPPEQMLANRAAKAPGWSTGSHPPPLPQAPPSWWGTSPGTWRANPPPAPVTWQVITTSPWDDDWKSTGQYWDRQSWNRTWDNWNWNNRTWTSWESTDDWWNAPGTDDNSQEY